MTVLVTIEALDISIGPSVGASVSSSSPFSSPPFSMRELNTHFTPIDWLVVQRSNGLLGILFVFHFHKSKSWRISGRPGRNDSPIAGEGIFNGPNFDLRVQVTNVNLHWSAHPGEGGLGQKRGLKELQV